MGHKILLMANQQCQSNESNRSWYNN